MLSKTFASVAAFASLAAGNAWAATNWVKAESDNFIVYSNTGDKATEAYVRTLEQYRYVIGAMYRRSGENMLPEPKLNMYFLKKHSDFKQVWPDVGDNVGGFVRICGRGMAGYSLYEGDRIQKASKVQNQAENDSQTIIFHEYAHLFMFQNSRVAYPRWFVEGFAEFYGTTKIQGDQAVVGMAWSGRVYSLRSGGSLKYEDILNDAPRTRREAAQGDFYAQSWLLTHWIMSDPERAKAFSAYVTARNRGEDPVKAFEAAFGVPVKSLSATLNRYMSDLKATLYRIRDMPDPKISLSPMPASADKLLLWDSGTRSCLAEDVGAKILTSIRSEAANYPDDPYARAVLARAEIVLGDEEKALDHYTAYTAANPDDPEGFYRLGQTWFLMARHDKFAPGETFESQMKKARKAFGRAYQLDPLNADNLYYFSMTGQSGPDGPDESSLNAAYEAHLLAPSVTEYAMHAAVLLIQKGQLEDAATALTPIANNPHGGKFAQWVAGIVGAIETGKSKDEVYKLITTPMPKDEPENGEEDKSKDRKD